LGLMGSIRVGRAFRYGEGCRRPIRLLRDDLIEASSQAPGRISCADRHEEEVRELDHK